MDDDQNDFILFLVLESSQKSFQFPTKCFQRIGFHEMHFLTSHSQTNNLHFTIKAISLTYRQNYSYFFKKQKSQNMEKILVPGYFLNISWFRDISEYFEKYVLVHGYPEYAEEYLLYPRENAQSDKMIELEWHKIIIKKKEVI